MTKWTITREQPNPDWSDDQPEALRTVFAPTGEVYDDGKKNAAPIGDRLAELQEAEGGCFAADMA